MSAISIATVCRRFAGRIALEDVDLDIADRECVALTGPSGCGKTTLLRIVAGLEKADRGRIAIDGVDMAGIPAERRRIGFVFQHYALFPHMSVAANVAFGPVRLTGEACPAAPAIADRCRSLLDRLGLGEMGGRAPSELSGGQRQRVALARALAAEPRILLLDEPFAALDAETRSAVRDMLRAIHDERRLTTILVTHDRDDAGALADRVVTMREGRIVQGRQPTGHAPA